MVSTNLRLPKPPFNSFYSRLRFHPLKCYAEKISGRKRVMTRALIILLSAMLATACAKAPEADLALINGQIYTGDEGFETVQALAVNAGRIAALGSLAEIKDLIGENTQVIDLKGQFAMPGFNDAHVHVHNAATRIFGTDLVGTASLEEMCSRVQALVDKTPAGQWIFGRGWDENLWPVAKVPGRQDLDALSTDHPILLRRVDGHSSVANSMALELAGFDCRSPAPDGGVIECGADGQPTGWIKETASELATALVPPPGKAERIAAYKKILQEIVAAGVTSIQDDSIRVAGGGWAYMEAMQTLKASGDLPVRVTTWLPFDAGIEQLLEWRDQGGTEDPWLKTGLLKASIDGSGGSLTAAMLEPYTTGLDNRGVLIVPEEQLTAMTRERVQAGFQLGIHSIGDRANRVVLNALEAALDIDGSKELRHRVEHAQFLHDKDVPRFAAMNVIASAQPSHLLTDMRWAPRILGPEREHEGYRWASLWRSGAMLAFGTDYPVELISPMRTLYGAVAREFETGGPPGGWIPEEKLTIDEAIQAYTWGSAFAEFEDHRKGTLVPGKLADIVVLSKNIRQVPAADILKTEVVMTIVGGQLMYAKNGD